MKYVKVEAKSLTGIRMIFIAVLRSNGTTVGQGNSAIDAYNAAIAAGYHPADFTVVPISQGPRV